MLNLTNNIINWKVNKEIEAKKTKEEISKTVLDYEKYLSVMISKYLNGGKTEDVIKELDSLLDMFLEPDKRIEKYGKEYVFASMYNFIIAHNEY